MMIKKKYGTTDNFDVVVNLDKAAIEIYQHKEVVEETDNPITQIDLDSVHRFEPDMEIGDEYIEIIDPGSFGRRLVNSARQALSQRLRDIEKKLVLNEFNNRIGEIIVGEIRQVQRKELIVSFERTELIMPKDEQIANERYKRGETIKALVKAVIDDQRGPKILISRSDPQFLMKLFENEVPEIYDGIIEIKMIARDPGERTKIAVYSNDKRIDAVGACVGMKGIRIQAIVKELNNEKIDIVNWSHDPEVMISRALSPAKPIKVEVDTSEHHALAIINDDEMSIAVGRHGQNINLASRLTGYSIQTIKYSEVSSQAEQEFSAAFSTPTPYTDADELEPEREETDSMEIQPDTLIADIKGISKVASDILNAAGYIRLGDVTDIQDIHDLQGITARSKNKLISILNRISN
jgi:N utilization substance protein A